MPTLTALIRSGLAKERPDAVAERSGGTFTPTSSARLLERAENVALALRDLGLSAGDRVAVMAPNSVAWIVADFGVLFAGCVVVPIFPTQSLDDVAFILSDSESKAIFVESAAEAARLRAVAPDLTYIIFDAHDGTSLTAFEERGGRVRVAAPHRVGSYEREAAAGDLAILIYTSGTTGKPKGVMLSHDNLASNVTALFDFGFTGIAQDERVLSVLPFSHIYECEFVYGYVRAGLGLYVCHAPEELLADLREVQPAAMTSVPRIFERVLAGIVAKAQSGSPLRAKLLRWSLATGREYWRAKALANGPGMMLRLKHAIAHALVLKKIRPMLGLTNLKYFCSGSAPLHLDTALIFRALDILILQGYGLTEASPVITASTLAHNRFGSVGRALPNVQVRIAADGEVCAKGPNIMLGYHHDPQATAQTIDPEGWLHTGDIGRLDDDGFLYITDRKKELFKTSGGKYLSPARIESAIARSVFINQVVLVGNNRPHPLALIAPNWDLVRKTHAIADHVPAAELAARPDILEFLRAEVADHTAELAAYEQVRRIVLLPRDLTIADGELSPTMKVKRREVERTYAGAIEAGYAHDLKAAVTPAPA